MILNETMKGLTNLLVEKNIELHKINTSQKSDFHVPFVSLSKVQKGVYYSGIILFNSPPLNIKQVAHDINNFKHKLRKFLIENSFYSVEEYLDRNNKFDLGVSQ
jgi:hypothetical protein